MRDILELFISPEECAKEILNTKGERTIRKALITIAKVVVLIGCIMGLSFKTSLPNILGLLSKTNPDIVNQINELSATNLGAFSVVVTLFLIILLYCATILSALIMAVLLFVIKAIMGGEATFKQLFRVTLYSQVIYSSIMLVTQVCTLVASLTVAGVIASFIILIIGIFQFWYLIFIVVGYNIVNKVSFLKSILAAFMMQGVLWGVQLGLLLLSGVAMPGLVS